MKEGRPSNISRDRKSSLGTLASAGMSAEPLVMSDSANLWTVAHQAPPSMGFSRQEHWSELPFPSPGELPNPGIKPTSLTLAHRFFITEQAGKLHFKIQ